MNQKKILIIRLEIIWWIFTSIILGGILYPILTKIEGYPFLFSNIFFVVSFFTLTRYIFLLKHTLLAQRELLKIALIFLCIPLLFFLVKELLFFRNYLDETGLETLVENKSLEEQNRMVRYIRSEMLFFGVGSVISGLLFPFRMLVSVWRVRNRGTV